MLASKFSLEWNNQPGAVDDLKFSYIVVFEATLSWARIFTSDSFQEFNFLLQHYFTHA